MSIDEFGDPSTPPALLLAGAAQSMDWWEPGFLRSDRATASASMHQSISGPSPSSGLPLAGGDPGVPPAPKAELTEAESRIPQVNDWAAAEAVIGRRIAQARAFAGSATVTERRIRAIAGREFVRSTSLEATETNRFLPASGPSPIGPSESEAHPPLPFEGDSNEAASITQ